jgi:hypothetical protein
VPRARSTTRPSRRSRTRSRRSRGRSSNRRPSTSADRARPSSLAAARPDGSVVGSCRRCATQDERCAAALQPADASEGVGGREKDRHADQGDEHAEAERDSRHEYDKGDDAGRPAEQEVGEVPPGGGSNRPDQHPCGGVRRVHGAHDRAAKWWPPCGYQASPGEVSRSVGRVRPSGYSARVHARPGRSFLWQFVRPSLWARSRR